MTKAEARKRIEALAREIREHDHRYWVLDRPTIPDAQYDRLFRELQALEEAYPDLLLLDSPTQRVSGPMREAFRKVCGYTDPECGELKMTGARQIAGSTIANGGDSSPSLCVIRSRHPLKRVPPAALSSAAIVE